MSPRSERHDSATSWVLDCISYSFIVRRDGVRPPKLKEVSDEREKRKVLGSVRYVIQALRKKNMVFLITKRFIINIPLVLTYYTLRDRNTVIVAEVLRSGNKLSRAEALNVVRLIVSNYYNYFESFINDLLEFYKTYRKLLLVLNDYEVRYKLEEKLYEYLPFIIIESRYREKTKEGKISKKRKTLEFLSSVVKIVNSTIDRRTVERLSYQWSLLQGRIDALSFDDDPHVESIASRFLDRTTRYLINILLPAHDETLEIKQYIKNIEKAHHYP